MVLLNARNLYLPGCHKLSPRWVGLFPILSWIGATTYKLDLKGKYSRLHPVFHVSLLKAHVQGGSGPSSPDPIEVDSKTEYVVERILGHRILRSKT